MKTTIKKAFTSKSVTNKTAPLVKKAPAKKAPAKMPAPVAKKAPAKRTTANTAAAKTTSGKPAAGVSGPAASKKIDQRIAELGDWRGQALAQYRKLIHEVDRAIQEEWKWMGTPVWSHDGGVCTGESYKQVVKLTFFRGAALADPKKLFNSSLEGNVRRAIDLREGDKINEPAFKALIREAIAANSAIVASRRKK